MSVEDTWISSLVDGRLPEEQAEQLAASLRQNPALVSRLLDELVISDLLSRELNPERAHALFLAQLNTLLDNVSLELDPKRSDAAPIESFASSVERTAEDHVKDDAEIIEFPRMNEDELREAHEATKPPLHHTWKRSKAMRLIVQMAAAFVLCAGLLWYLFPQQDSVSGSIARINDSGSGFTIHRGEQVIVASQGMPLRHGDLIVSSMPDQQLAFNFTDGSTVSLNEGGSIRVEEFRRKGKLLSLESGSAQFQVTPQKKLFQVATQHGKVTVVGTAFTVKTSASSMDLDVTKGVVDVENVMKHKIAVQAGEQAFARKDQARIRHTLTLLATHDATVKNGRLEHIRYGLEEHVFTTTRVRGKAYSDFLLKFDLSSCPKNINHASLRLYCTEIKAQVDTITVNVANHKNWTEKKINWEGAPEKKEPILAGWSPKVEQYNTIDLSDAILSELDDQRPLSLRLSGHGKNELGAQGQSTFASRQHPDQEKWPALILEIEDK